jgi:hypothetical protein
MLKFTRFFILAILSSYLAGCAGRSSVMDPEYMNNFARNMAEHQVIAERCPTIKLDGNRRITGAFAACLMAKSENKKCAAQQFINSYDRQLPVIRKQYQSLPVKTACAKAYDKGKLKKIYKNV